MNKKQEQNMTEELFWQQFPEGTEEFAFSLVEHFKQAMDETGKKGLTIGVPPVGQWVCDKSRDHIIYSIPMRKHRL